MIATASPRQVDAALDILGPLGTALAPLGALTTYRVGGPAAVGVHATSIDDLDRVRLASAETQLPVMVLGKGSNVLVADAGFPGIAVTLGDRFADIHVHDDNSTRVRAGGGAALPVVARRTSSLALTGFEWAVGVPGSIGGAVRMNAGGHGSDMASSVCTAFVVDLAVDGASRSWQPHELGFSYRSSTLSDHHVVAWVDLQLAEGTLEDSEAMLAEIVRWRRANQPGGQNCGSVFTNPANDAAGRLVDLAECKGLRIGTAQVSAKHANFIQADAQGSADDVARVIRTVRHRVRAEFGVDLHPEVRFVGFDGTAQEVTA